MPQNCRAAAFPQNLYNHSLETGKQDLSGIEISAIYAMQVSLATPVRPANDWSNLCLGFYVRKYMLLKVFLHLLDENSGSSCVFCVKQKSMPCLQAPARWLILAILLLPLYIPLFASQAHLSKGASDTYHRILDVHDPPPRPPLYPL